MQNASTATALLDVLGELIARIQEVRLERLFDFSHNLLKDADRLAKALGYKSGPLAVNCGRPSGTDGILVDTLCQFEPDHGRIEERELCSYRLEERPDLVQERISYSRYGPTEAIRTDLLALLNQWRRDVSRRNATATTPALNTGQGGGAPASGRGDGKPDRTPPARRITQKEANVKAREYLQKNPTATARELADGIGCSVGLVSELPAWKAVVEQRKKGREPRPPKAISLTEKLDSTLGRDDAELKKLTDEQRADDEDHQPMKIRARRKP